MSSELEAHEHGLVVAADLITVGSSSPYLVDASGYLRAISHMAAKTDFPEAAAWTARTTMRAVSDYAAASDNTGLASHVFEYYENVVDKWRLYGIAAVAGTIEQLPDWSLWAASEETLEATGKHQRAAAAMHIVRTKIALAEHAGSSAGTDRHAALSESVSHKREAIEALGRDQQRNYDSFASWDEIDECYLALDSLFAERGLWQEVDSPKPRYPLNELPRGNQLVAKAAVGELGWRDMRKLRRNWMLYDLLLVNAMANGEAIPEQFPKIDEPLVGNPLLAAAAPKAFVHLGLATREQLDTYLKAGKAEAAAREYFGMQGHGEAPGLLVAALQMAPYTEELAAVQGAYGVHRGHVAHRIDVVQDFTAKQDWRGLPHGEAAAMQPIIKELGGELHSLDERIDRLLASVRQFAIAQEVDPASEEANSALYRLRENWDELEPMESYNDRLPELAVELKKHGIIFVNEWKLFPSDEGYVGYGLAAPGIPRQESGDGTFFLLPYRFEWWKDAARKLQELHGDDRFMFVVHTETKPGTGDHSSEILRRVGIEGNWRERGLSLRELIAAEGVASWIPGGLNTLPNITNRLMALRLADA